MALAVDASSPIRFAGTPANNVDITSASFTPPAGAILVACVSADTVNATTDITMSVTDSQGLTWTNRGERDGGDAGAQGGHASVYTSTATAASAMTVSVRRTVTGGSTNRISVKIYVVTGQHATPAGGVNEGSSTTNNLTTGAVTTTGNNSLVFIAGTEWNARGLPTSSDLTADAADYPASLDVISGYKAVATSGTAATGNLDAGSTTAAAWNWVGLEILAAAAATTSAPPLSGIPAALLTM